MALGWATGAGPRCFQTVPNGGGEHRRLICLAAEAFVRSVWCLQDMFE
jgi:hypothetical protein